MDDVTQKHKKFFAKANAQPLAEILRTLPPVEQRIFPKPDCGAVKNDVAHMDRATSGSWDFKIDDDSQDGLEGLPEHES
eukprot:CAMPEP_0168443458 /NCGR_PEP_ID=MMETSP0228-20121227/44541_1 /TAXON_ID=133427 /ORGANISM="Protoceratium reticulatum, Strain CCCM 535 (=CCMP 1889)" /LENGTH=78 /DNA_ID=CAMNT_0008457865 /DNA_START=33 /DNA_END=269 /DNA_ORIENTATION=-